MADPPAASDPATANSAHAESASHPGMPRWVKAAVAVVLVLVVVLVVSKLVGVEHGPGRHGDGAGAPASQAAPSDAGAAGHTPPAGIPEHGAP